MEQKLSIEVDRLRGEMGRNERLATTITDQMHHEVQGLLRLFGTPYLVGPAEAEAQCAFLDSSGQTEGTITDDSDVFLFGAKRVVRHLFERDEVSELYSSEEIERKLCGLIMMMMMMMMMVVVVVVVVMMMMMMMTTTLMLSVFKITILLMMAMMIAGVTALKKNHVMALVSLVLRCWCRDIVDILMSDASPKIHNFIVLNNLSFTLECPVLDQGNLICMAMLCGCDYTDGIRGVGPVTATEIIQEFKGLDLDCLIKFR